MYDDCGTVGGRVTEGRAVDETLFDFGNEWCSPSLSEHSVCSAVDTGRR